MTGNNTNDTWNPNMLYNPDGSELGEPGTVSIECVTTVPDGLTLNPQRVWITTGTGLLKYTSNGTTIKTVTSTIVLLVNDTFNRANNGYLGTATSGQTWTDYSAAFGIVSNLARVNSSLGNNVAAINASKGDNISASVKFTTNVTSRLIFRILDKLNYLIFGYGTDGTYSIAKMVDGVLTVVATSTTTITDADIVRVELRGNTITGYVNTVLVATATDAFNNTQTLMGMGNASGTGANFDNFQVAPI